MLSLDDTIAAIATPLGEGGIGIVRLSGPQAVALASRVFVPGKANRHPERESHRLLYGHIVDPASGSVVDEVLMTVMRAPSTYTRQDVAEIHCHAGMVPLRNVLELVLRLGARPAEPGEFTLRAFVNGRIDLAQAEAVLDLVRAKTDAGLRMALQQLRGRTSEEITAIRSTLIGALAHVEASLDFPHDEIPHLDLDETLRGTRVGLEQLLVRADEGMVYRQGVRTAIVGRPNVGKSSLLNALLRTSRAIVTPIPGTTRDTLEETVNLRGVPLCLVDTAGITESTDLIERLGVERSQHALRSADLVLMVVALDEPLQSEDWAIADQVEESAAIVVENKVDLLAVVDARRILPRVPHVQISALTGQGLDRLEDTLVSLALGGRCVQADLPLVSNPRHCEALKRALASVASAIENQGGGEGRTDLVAVDLRAAIGALGEITGVTVGEDVLSVIFSSFCIGK